MNAEPLSVPGETESRQEEPCTNQTQDLVITVHGIRDHGSLWQSMFEQALRETNPDINVCHFEGGFYDLFSFLVPVFHWELVRRFRLWLKDTVSRTAHPEIRRVHIVAHSFGTYLVGKALSTLQNDPDVCIHTVILAGSCMKSTFLWQNLIAKEKVKRVVNECGQTDWVLLLSQVFGLYTGMAGRIGFIGGTGDQFRNRYYPFGHTGYFYRDGEARKGNHDDTFMRTNWIPLLTEVDGAIPSRPIGDSAAGEKLTNTIANHAEPLKVGWYILLFYLVIGLPLSYMYGLYKQAERERIESNKREELVQQLTEVGALVEGAKLSDHKGNRLRDFFLHDKGEYTPSQGAVAVTLLADLRDISPETQSRKEMRQRLDKLRKYLKAQQQLTPTAQHLYGLVLLKRSQLAEPGSERNRLLDFRSKDIPLTIDLALNASEGAYANPKSPQRLLALYDSALCLDYTKKDREAVTRLEEILKHRNSCPAWLLVATYEKMGTLLRKQGKNHEARKAFEQIQQVSTASPERCASLWRRIGWLSMDHASGLVGPRKLREARSSFEEARKHAKEIPDEPTRQLMEALLDHGFILLDYYEAKTVNDRFTALIQKMDNLLANADDFTPVQRRQLRSQAINTRERLADSVLLGQGRDPKKATSVYQGVVQYIREIQDTRQDLAPHEATRAKILYKLALALATVGNPEEARKQAQEAGKAARRAGVAEQSRFTMFAEVTSLMIQTVALAQTPSRDQDCVEMIQKLQSRIALELGKNVSLLRHDESALLLLAQEWVTTHVSQNEQVLTGRLDLKGSKQDFTKSIQMIQNIPATSEPAQEMIPLFEQWGKDVKSLKGK